MPTDADWTTLTNCLGGSMDAGGKMKEIGTVHWENPNMGATNFSGFTALPGGQRDYFGVFKEIKKKGYWYGVSLDGQTQGWNRILFSSLPGVSATIGADKWGYSVRCLKD